MDTTLTASQQEAFDKIISFFNNDSDIFVLKGYAGTGKTHIIECVAQYLNGRKVPYEIVAPTGRAAKVLRDRMGRGRTIHSCIFNLDMICLNDEESDSARASL